MSTHAHEPDAEPILSVGVLPDDDELNRLFAAAWPDHDARDWSAVLGRSLTWVCARQGGRLVGFVNVAWDGGLHGFLLDTTVDPLVQRRGLGRRLVRAAANEAAARGLHWLHVDYEPHLDGFYRGCGFAPALAGLLRLDT